MPGWQYYDLPPELIPQTWGGRYRGQKQKWFAMRFLEPDGEINIVPQQGHEQEFEEWQWVPFHDVERRVVPFKAHVYREVLNAFAGLARPGGA